MAKKYESAIDNSPKLEGISGVEKWEDLREVFLKPENQSLLNCIRHPSETPVKLITPDQIGENHILAQSSTQREIMSVSTHLAVDQNEKCKPVGCCRTLTLMSKYKGNFKSFFFVYLTKTLSFCFYFNVNFEMYLENIYFLTQDLPKVSYSI